MIALGSWFRKDGKAQDDQADSTVEVKADVIAQAIRAGNAQRLIGQPVAAPPQHYPQQPAPQGQTEAEAAVTEMQPEQGMAEQPDTDVTATLLDQALTERRTLVQLCLYALDRARSAGVTERIEETLGTIGVSALRPDGAKFDPTLHEAGGTVDTENAELDGTVAETEVVGFSDRGTTLRVPVVTVYTVKNTQGAAT